VANAPLDDAGKFRHYAAEYQRLAEKADAQDKPILLDPATAWMLPAPKPNAEQKQSRRIPDLVV
jgi:hypothetical protein